MKCLGFFLSNKNFNFVFIKTKRNNIKYLEGKQLTVNKMKILTQKIEFKFEKIPLKISFFLRPRKSKDARTFFFFFFSFNLLTLLWSSIPVLKILWKFSFFLIYFLIWKIVSLKTKLLTKNILLFDFVCL